MTAAKPASPPDPSTASAPQPNPEPKRRAPPSSAPPDTRFSMENVAKLLFSAARNEPKANPTMVGFFRGMVVAQSYFIVILLGTVVMTGLIFAQKTFYHLLILDRDSLPSRTQIIYPFTEPNLTGTAITNMAMNLVTEVLTFGFHNADGRLLSARHLFTEECWQRFAKAYLQYGRLEAVKRNQQVITAIATAGAVVVAEGKINKRERWVVQVPIAVTFQAGAETATKRSILQLTLVRASTLKHPEGVAIDGWEELAAGFGQKQGSAIGR
jgi:hypothetical protein